MNKELDERLTKRYPKVFQDRYKGMQETCMCWGFEHGDGWYALIDELAGAIQWHCDQMVGKKEWYFKRWTLPWKWQKPFQWIRKKTSVRSLIGRINSYILFKLPIGTWHRIDACPQVVAEQVKEKFGTLRFYYRGGDDIIDGMVRMAEAMSGRICDQCGTTADVGHTKGWIQTMCKICYEQSKRRMANNWESNDVDPRKYD